MATETILAVKKAEETANEILEEAALFSRKTLDESTKKAEEEYKQIILEANKEAELIKKTAVNEGEAIAKPILEKGKAEAETLGRFEEQKLKEMTNIIIERVVKKNGNS